MDRKELATKGSTIGIVSQVISIILKFAVRTFAIRVLGKEILGLDSVLLDTINVLSVAELGVTSAMSFRLYVPIIQKDRNKIISLMATYKLIYFYIAAAIATIGILLSFSLPYIIKGISVSWPIIYIAFYLQLINTALPYLISYKQVLLVCDQKRHIRILTELVTTVVFSGINIIVLIVFKNYIIYLISHILQTTIFNFAVNKYINKNYPYLSQKTKANKNDIKLIIGDTKHVFASKLAEYVFGSTDSVITSIFINTGIVGLFSNYRYISIALKRIVDSAMSTIQPILGNYLNSDIPKEQSYSTLKRYTFIRFVIAGISAIPFVMAADTFIRLWAGNDEYLMESTIAIFLACDYYIACVYGPLNEYIVSMGLFKDGKFAMLAGMIVNIVFSIIGVTLWGCSGVILATAVSQLVIWGCDIYIVLGKYYKEHPEYLKDYIKINMIYIFEMVFVVIFVSLILNVCVIDNLWIKLIFNVVVSVLIYIIITIISFRKTDEYIFSKELLVKALASVRFLH